MKLTDRISFTGGLHDDIIIQLSKIEDLKVIARSSVIEYLPGDRNLQQIGEDLGVSSVLEGNVRRAGNTIRVSVQLIDVDNLETVWGEVYDRKLTDLFAIQSNIAREIAGALQANITPQEQDQIDRLPTGDMEAYELYLRGNSYLNRPGYIKEDWENAISLYERAVKLDPGFVHAYSSLSVVHGQMHWFAFDQTPERMEKVRLNAEKAMSIDPEHPASLLAMGNYYYRKRNYSEALRYFEQRLQYLPNDARTIALIGYIQRRMGHWESSVQKLEKVIDLDPLNNDVPFQLVQSYFYLRNFEKAREYINRSLEISPDFIGAKAYRPMLKVAQKGETGPLKQFLRENRENGKEYPIEWIDAMFLLREYKEILEIVNSWETEIAENQDFILPASLARGLSHHYLGNTGQSKSQLKKARQYLERRKSEKPDDPRVRAALGMAYAYADMPEPAAREAEKMMEIMPVEEDALLGSSFIVYAAHIYAQTGNVDRALELIDRGLSIPSNLAVHFLELHPRWDPLRGHPEFQELINKY